MFLTMLNIFFFVKIEKEVASFNETKNYTMH